MWKSYNCEGVGRDWYVCLRTEHHSDLNNELHFCCSGMKPNLAQNKTLSFKCWLLINGIRRFLIHSFKYVGSSIACYCLAKNGDEIRLVYIGIQTKTFSLYFWVRLNLTSGGVFSLSDVTYNIHDLFKPIDHKERSIFRYPSLIENHCSITADTIDVLELEFTEVVWLYILAISVFCSSWCSFLANKYE